MATILKQKMKTVFMPTALALLISACASENLVTQSIKNEAYASSEFYINKADSVKDEEDKITYHLLAVRKLIEENKAEEAQNTFDELTNAPKLMEALQKNEVQKTEYALVSAQLYAARGNNEQAQTLLRNLPLAQLSQVQMLRFYQTQANIAENQRDPVEIVRAVHYTSVKCTCICCLAKICRHKHALAYNIFQTKFNRVYMQLFCELIDG